jgi:simple sugar transport system ATP-binding protein
LGREADLLVLDEPTSALAEQEIRSLFATLRRLRAAGKTIVLITHKVREVLDISDSVTVMRAGRVVDRLDTASTDESRLAALMMGGAAIPEYSRAQRVVAPEGAKSFEMRNVRLRARGRVALDGLSLSVRRGEVLGLCGVAGNGLGEVEDLAAGLLRPDSGEVLVEGQAAARMRRPGLGYVPADRTRRGACLDASLEDNLVALDRAVFFPRGLADRRAARAFARGAIERFSIKASPGDRFGSLSGGTMQKAILARELSRDASFLLFSNPTWGLDVASARFVHERIAEARDRGAAVLLISSNLDELLALSDRISALYKGRAVCELANGPELTRERLGEYMLGLRDDFAQAGASAGARVAGP